MNKPNVKRLTPDFIAAVVASLRSRAVAQQLNDSGPHMRINNTTDYWPSTNKHRHLPKSTPDDRRRNEAIILAARADAYKAVKSS